MSDDYLWDGQGSDPEVERLEKLLSGYRYKGQAPEPTASEPTASEPTRMGRWPWALALAAAALLAVGLPRLMPEEEGVSWAVSHLEGNQVCDDEFCVLGVGDWLETDEESRVMLEVADIGHMEVGPDTRLRLKSTGAEEHRLELAHGRIDAVVTAPPRLLVVETPVATAVDLGCAYTLEVDEAGNGELLVRTGYVSLETEDRVAWVPAGAEAQMRVASGPGTPMFSDAPQALRSALDTLDVQGGPIEPALAAARPRDTLSLWHLLHHGSQLQRGAVLDRILELAPHLAVERELLLVGDAEALEALRQELEPVWDGEVPGAPAGIEPSGRKAPGHTTTKGSDLPVDGSPGLLPSVPFPGSGPIEPATNINDFAGDTGNNNNTAGAPIH